MDHCQLAPMSARAAAGPPGPETGLGPSRTMPLTAVPDGASVRLQELEGSGRSRWKNRAPGSGSGRRRRGPFGKAKG
eukprot:9743098-Alexandrium_andersonii.AAC.1